MRANAAETDLAQHCRTICACVETKDLQITHSVLDSVVKWMDKLSGLLF